MSGQKRGKANHAPFLEIERLKKDFLHQLERFAKRLEDLNPRLFAIHGAI